MTEGALFDRFAAFYDGDYRDYDDDLDALLELAVECGDPILELGCGTGRVAIPLAQAGQRVVGVDISPGLLNVARSKLERAVLGSLVSLTQGDLRTFDLAEKEFGLAICTSNTLMHFTTPAEQLAVLRNAHRHLRTGGALFIDLFNPDIPRLLKVNGLMELADQWRDEDADAQVIKWSVRSIDLAEQLQETLFIYEQVFDDGRVRKTLCPFTVRYLWRNEGELMLAAAGFTVEDVWGDFDGSPFGGASDHLIFVARK